MFATRFTAKHVVMTTVLLAAGLCSFEVVTAAEAGLGLSDVKAIAKARIEGTLEHKAAMAKRIIDEMLHREATSTLNAASATPTPTIPTTGVILVVVSFVTRITTFTVANFTAIPQQQYVDAIYQSTPDVLQVVINSIIPGSVIVSTSAVLPQTQVSNFSTAADNSFGLPPATFGQPEISPLTVTLAPGNSTLPESTLPLATATPPPQTIPEAQTTVSPRTTVQPQTTQQPLGTTAPLVTTSQPLTSTVPSTTVLMPTTTPGVTSTLPPPTSSGPPASTPTPRTCASPTKLTFSGRASAVVPPQGPLTFTGWRYDTAGPSNPPIYAQAIYQASSPSFISVTDPRGILLCSIAATGYFPLALNATFTGTILGSGGQTVTKTQAVTGYSNVTDVTFDSSWQPLSALVITYNNPIDVYAISYTL